MGTITYYVGNVEQLNQALIWAGKAGGADNGQADNHVIELAAGWTIPLTQELVAINMSNDGDTLTINGNGATLDGGNWTRGLFVYSGTVAINDLTIANTVATGGDGGSGISGGGGGAGLGGGLFVAGTSNGSSTGGGNVTINNVHFVNNAANGGNGGAALPESYYIGGNVGFHVNSVYQFAGGGGGMGGAGGNAGLESQFGWTGAGGGGGGIGLGADGGNGGSAYSGYNNDNLVGGPGGNGIVLGATGGSGYWYVHYAGQPAGDAGVPGTSGGGGGGGGFNVDGNSNAGGGGVIARNSQTAPYPINLSGGGFGGGGGGHGQSGGFGGFGGGGAAGGAGGFGGGGSGLGGGNNGGWGAGDGGTNSNVYAGAGGGGGLGAGGAIFVQQGGSLTIAGSSDQTGGLVDGGSGRNGGTDGAAYGSGIFIQGYNTQVNFAPGAGQTQTINGVIADQHGSDPTGTGYNMSGRIAMSGLGTLVLNGHNTFTGGVSINSGRVELGDSTAAGIASGNYSTSVGNTSAIITMGADTALVIGLNAYPTNYIRGFNIDDTIDLKDFGNSATATFHYFPNYITVSNGSITKTLNLDPTLNFAGYVARTASDGHGGINVFLSTTPAANLLVDGDFQLVDTATGGLGVHYEPTKGNFAGGSPYGWTGSGTSFGFQLPTSAADPAFAGSKVVFLEANSSISQTFAAPAKYASYKVDLDLSSRLDIGQFTTVKVQVYAGTQLVGEQTFDTTSAGLGNAGHFSITTSDLATAGLLGQHITVSVTNTGGQQVFVDNIVASGLNLQSGAAPGTAGNLLVDGNFEQVNLGAFGPGVTLSAAGNYRNGLPTGWTSFTGSVAAQQPTYEVAPGMGASVVGVVNAFSSMSQTFAAPGLYNTYQFSLDVADRADGGAGPASGTIRIYAGNVLIGEQAYDTSTAGPGSAQHIVINTSALNSEPLFSQHLFRQNITITVSNTSGGQLLFDNVIATGLNLITQTTPTIAPISSQIIEATGASGAAAVLAGTATDNIDKNAPVVFKEGGNTVISGTFSVGTHNITASATNSGNLSSSTSFQIVVQDTTAPMLATIADITKEATAANGAAVTLSASATDIVDTNVAIVFRENGNVVNSGTFSIGTHNITATATDDYGNSSTKTFKIVVQDTTAPAFTVGDQVVEATAASGAVFSQPATASDAVSGAVPIVYMENGSTLTLNQWLGFGVHQITATATDAAGLTTTKTFSFTVQDKTAPVLSFANLTLEAVGAGGNAVTFATIASDAVDGARTIVFTENGSAVASGDTFSIGTHAIHAVVSDTRGNTATQDFIITVQDTTGPVLSFTNLTLEAVGAGGAAATFATAANDLVDGVRTISFTENGSAIASGDTFAIGTHAIHAVVSDLHGNTTMQDFTITVKDTIAPSLSTQENIVKQAATAGGATATFLVVASDTVDGATTVVYKDGATVVHSGDLFAIGSHTIVATSTDAHGNSATTSFTIDIDARTAPTIGAAPDLFVEATGVDGAQATFSIGATDVVDGANVAITYSESGTLVASGDLFSIGTHVITVTATDSYPLTSTTTFVINVRDTTAPTLSAQGNITANTADDAGTAVTFSVTATDLVEGNRDVVFTDNGNIVHSGDVFSVGAHTITATSQDSRGNTSSETFKIFVLNTTTVTTAQELSDAIRVIDEASQASGGTNTNYVINIAEGVTLLATSDIWAVNLRGTDTLTINGHGATLDGNSGAGVENAHRGLFVYTGNVTINDLTIEHTVAQGGAGYDGGGGGLGAGGGLFVANDTANHMAPGRVTLNNVVFNDNQAVGGAGSMAVTWNYGGGGGMGGDANSDRGGGGPLGVGTDFGVGNDPYMMTGPRFGGGDFTYGGNAGYGGGGGGGLNSPGYGFGGGIGYSDGGAGGGMGAGGGIFVMEGAQLIINGGSLAGGHIAAGQNGSPDAVNDQYTHYDAYAFGDGIFIQGNGSLTFAPTAGTTQTVASTIADEAGSGGSRSNPGYSTLNAEGHGSLIVDGAGTLALGAANTFTGGITINHGSLDLTNAAAAGSGAITLAQTADSTLTLASGFNLANVIKGFDLNDEIDLEGFAATSVSPVADVNGVVTLTDANGATRTLKFDAAKSVAGFFSITPDGHGGTILKLSAVEELVAHNMEELNGFLRAMDAESLLTGGSGKHYVVKLAADATFLATTDIATINLHGGDTLTIDGQGRTIDGDGAHRGLFVYAGDVTVKDLTIKDMVARGGNGSGGIDPGGGAAGFGGGLFVANDVAGGGTASHVTLNNVHFEDGRAVGGNAGPYISPQYWVNQSATRHGGAGGMGGNAVLSETPVWSNSGSYYYVNYYSTPGGGIAGSGVLGDGSFGSAATAAAFGTGSVTYAPGFGGGAQAHGGMGAGGNVFVQAGATLVIEGGGTSGGTATGGTGYYAAYNGAAFGGGIYLQQSAGQDAPALTLYATNANPTLTIADVIAFQSSSTGLAIGDATHVNTGTVTLSANNAYTGATTVNSGTLLVDGSIAGSAVTVHSGGTLGGHGVTGAVTVQAGGTFAAGNSPGQITVASLNLAAGSTFAEELGGTTAGTGYDQTVVQGTIALNGATLSATLYNGFTPHVGDIFKIIDGPGAAISGTFTDGNGHALGEGATIFAGNAELRVSYLNGDVTLTDLAPAVVGITTVGANPSNATSDQFTVTFSKAMTGVDLADFSLVMSGSITATLGSVTAVDAYTYTVTVNGVSGTGSLRLDLNASGTGITTLAGDALDGGFAGATYAVDTVSPTVQIISDVARLKAGETATITFTFSDDPGASFTDSDIVVTGGTLDQISRSGLTWTAVFTPTPGVEAGTATIEVVAGAYADAVGNAGLGGSIDLAFDTLPPRVTLDLDAASDSGKFNDDNITNDTTPTFTGTGEDGATVTLYKAGYPGPVVLGTAIVSGGVWSITTEPLAHGSYDLFAQSTDAAGNLGEPSASLNLNVQLSPPSYNAWMLEGDSIIDGVSNDFGPQYQFTAWGGDYVAASIDGATWTHADDFSLNGLADGPHVVQLRAHDLAGNDSAPIEFRFTLDRHAPSLTITSDAAVAPAAGALITFTFDEDPGTSFTDTDIVVTGGTLAAISGTGLRRTALFTPDSGVASGTATINVAQGVYTDQATNGGNAASLSLPFDSLLPVTSAPDLTAASDSGKLDNDNITNDATPTFAGTGEEGTTVTLYGISPSGANVVLGTAVVSTGVWSVTTGLLEQGTYDLFAQSTDAAGNLGAASDHVQVRVQLTAQPPIGAFVEGDGIYDGVSNWFELQFQQSEWPTDHIEVSINGGAWTTTPQFVFDGSADGLYVVQARTVDLAGNDSAPIELRITMDTHAPSLTITSDVAPVGAAGAVITFTFTEDPGASFGDDDVVVTGGALGPITGTGLTRTAAFTPPANQAAGTASITVAAGRYTDAALNPGGQASLSLATDTVAPDAPSAPDLATASDSGKSSTDDITKVTTPTFTGTAEDGATIRLYDTDGTLLGSAVAVGGTWSITTTTLSEGAHMLSAIATDAAGNVSAASASLSVTIDTTPPATPTLVLVHDTGVSCSDGITSNPAIAYAATNGSFQADGGGFTSAAPVFATDGSADGPHTVTIQDEDAAGNISTSTLTFILDTSPPVAQDGSASSGADTTITGSLVATDDISTALVFSRVSQAAHGTVTVNTDGTFSYTPDAFFTGTDSFTFKANDGVFDSNVATVTLNVTAPRLIGTPGPDAFTALPGTAYIDALGGTDTITFGFRLVDATVTYAGSKVIIDTASSHTVLSGFETYVFTDGTVRNDDGDWLVDDLYYYSQNHDVWNAHVEADAHYHAMGWHEGRNPNAFFSTAMYLSANPDVKAAGIDPLRHFESNGWWEGRMPSITFDTRAYLAANPDVAAAHVDPLLHFLAVGAGEGREPLVPSQPISMNGFDYVYYLQHNPDVAAAGVDPYAHFMTTGWLEGRNPNAWFDVSGYLTTYTDVAASGMNPLVHYDRFGWHEGRDPSTAFDTAAYLAANPDVKAAGVDPLTHYLQFGIFEGRSPHGDGVWA
jgi:large repetitive protein